MAEMLDSVAELNRLRWRCTHRSLLEMDILLGGFLEAHFSGLTAEQARAFTALVEMEDLDLWPLIAGRRACASPLQAEIVAMLRNVRVT